MLNADRAVKLETCPRCGIGGYERLKTHAYCFDCNYTNDIDHEFIPQWAISLFRKQKIIRKKPILKNNQSDAQSLCIIDLSAFRDQRKP